jgi:hypothetical protein
MYIAGFSIFDNIDTLTVEQDDANQDAESALDFKQSTQWNIHSHNSVSFWVELTAPQFAEYLGIVGHNLGSEGVTLTVEYKLLVGDPWTVLMPTETITDDKAKLFVFPAGVNAPFYRVTFGGDNINTYVTQLQIGQGVDLATAYAPITPPLIAAESMVYGASENHHLGKKSRPGLLKQTIRIKNIDPAVADAYGGLLVDLLSRRPFFYAWNVESYPDEVIYCWAEKPIDAPIYLNNKLAELEIEVVGVI